MARDYGDYAYGEWNEPVDRWCRAWRAVRFGGGFMSQSCQREAGHDGDHLPLPLARPSVATTTTIGVVTYKT